MTHSMLRQGAHAPEAPARHPFSTAMRSDYVVRQGEWPETEKRQCRRRSLRCPMSMSRHGPVDTAADEIVGECLNVSDGGLYGIIPLDLAIAAGQRFLFRLQTHERGPEPGTQQTICHEGVVIRTELLLGSEGHRLGIAVRTRGRRSGVLAISGHA